MKQGWTGILTLALTAALATACGFDHERTIIGPTSLGMAPAASISEAPVQAAPPVESSVIGTWASATTATTQAITALPDIRRPAAIFSSP